MRSDPDRSEPAQRSGLPCCSSPPYGEVSLHARRYRSMRCSVVPLRHPRMNEARFSLLSQALTCTVFAGLESLRKLLAQPVNAMVRVHMSDHQPRSCDPLRMRFFPGCADRSLLAHLLPEPSHRCFVQEKVGHIGRLLRSVMSETSCNNFLYRSDEPRVQNVSILQSETYLFLKIIDGA